MLFVGFLFVVVLFVLEGEGGGGIGGGSYCVWFFGERLVCVWFYCFTRVVKFDVSYSLSGGVRKITKHKRFNKVDFI